MNYRCNRNYESWIKGVLYRLYIRSSLALNVAVYILEAEFWYWSDNMREPRNNQLCERLSGNFSLFAYLRIWLEKSKRFLNALQYAFGVRLIFFLLANFLEIIVSACSIWYSLGKWLQRLSCLHIKRPEVKELELEGQWKTFFVYFR